MNSPLNPGRSILTMGAGPPLVLAHGAGGGVKGNFTGFAAELVSSRHILGLDYPGSGNRALSEGPLSLNRLADDLVAAVVSAGFTSFPLVGVSLGGAVAITAASRHPDKVSGLVLTAAFPWADVQLLDNIAIFEALGSSPDPRARARFIFQSCFAPAMMTDMPSRVHEEVVESLAMTIPVGASAQYQLAKELDISALAESLEVPALVIVAGQDRMVLPATTRTLAEVIPNADRLEYADAGHAFVGAEVEAWAADVDRFLAKHQI